MQLKDKSTSNVIDDYRAETDRLKAVGSIDPQALQIVVRQLVEDMWQTKLEPMLHAHADIQGQLARRGPRPRSRPMAAMGPTVGLGTALTAATATVVATERRLRNCRQRCLQRPPQGPAAGRRRSRCNERDQPVADHRPERRQRARAGAVLGRCGAERAVAGTTCRQRRRCPRSRYGWRHQRAKSARWGIWNDVTGIPTGAGLVNLAADRQCVVDELRRRRAKHLDLALEKVQRRALAPPNESYLENQSPNWRGSGDHPQRGARRRQATCMSTTSSRRVSPIPLSGPTAIRPKSAACAAHCRRAVSWRQSLSMAVGFPCGQRSSARGARLWPPFRDARRAGSRRHRIMTNERRTSSMPPPGPMHMTDPWPELVAARRPGP